MTDDDLTRALSAAFEDETDGLTYTGRRRPPIGAVAVAVPAAAGLAGVAVLTSLAVSGGPTTTDRAAGPTLTGGPSVTRSTSGAVSSSPVLVNRSFVLAGRTFHYRAAPGAPDPVRLDSDATLPSDAQQLPASPDRLGQAWLGTDPASGDNAVYVKVETRNSGRLFAVISPVWSKAQLREFLETGTVR
ncbi:hypothetical protein [Jatrophihabitans fulvus]